MKARFQTSNTDRDSFAIYDEHMYNNVVNVHYVRDQQTIRYRMHQHNFYELLFIIEGDVSYNVEGRSYELRGGDIMLINKLELHQCRVKNSRLYERFVVWIHPDVVERWERLELQIDLLDCFKQCSSNHYNLLRLDSESFGAFLKMLHRLCDTEQSHPDDAHAQALVQALGLEILIMVNKCYQNPLSLSRGLSRFPDQRMDEVVDFINQNLSLPISLDMIAERFKMSKFYLSKIFKQYAGQSLYHFVLSKRLLQARYLIDNGMSPTRASLEAGFIDYSNFAKAFKRYYGVAPSKTGESRSDA